MFGSFPHNYQEIFTEHLTYLYKYILKNLPRTFPVETLWEPSEMFCKHYVSAGFLWSRAQQHQLKMCNVNSFLRNKAYLFTHSFTSRIPKSCQDSAWGVCQIVSCTFELYNLSLTNWSSQRTDHKQYLTNKSIKKHEMTWEWRVNCK